MRVTPRDLLGRVQPGSFEGSHHRGPASCPILLASVDGEWLRHQVEHGLPRIERLVRILEDHLQLRAHGTERALVQVGDVPAAKDDSPGVRLHQTHHGAGDRGLAAARLADQREHLARPDVEGHPIHRSDRLASSEGSASALVANLEIVDGENRSDSLGVVRTGDDGLADAHARDPTR